MSFTLDGSTLAWPAGGPAVIRQLFFERDKSGGGRHAYIAGLRVEPNGVDAIRGRLRFTDEEYLSVPGSNDEEKATEILQALQSVALSSPGLVDGFYGDVVTDSDDVHIFLR